MNHVCTEFVRKRGVHSSSSHEIFKIEWTKLKSDVRILLGPYGKWFHCSKLPQSSFEVERVFTNFGTFWVNCENDMVKW
jgi:hypothetical protein